MNNRVLSDSIKRIYKAEKLTIVSAVLLIAGSAVGFVAENTNKNYIGIAALLVLLCAALLAVAAFVHNFFGVKKAAGEEPAFKKAFLWLILGLIAKVLNFLLENIEGSFVDLQTLSSFFQAVSEVAETVFIYFVLGAISAIADKMHHHKLEKKCASATHKIIFVQILSLIMSLLSTVLNAFGLEESFGGTLATSIMGIVAVVLSVVSYVLYLNILSGTIKMLEESAESDIS